MSRVTHLLNRSATIIRLTQSADGQGGFTTSESTVASPSGRRHAARGNDRLIAGREEAGVTHIWYFEHGTDVTVRDIVRNAGTDYEVLNVQGPSLDDHLRVETKEVQVGG